MSRIPFLLNDVRVEPDRNLLVCRDDSVSVEPKIMDVLCLLASDPGAVFTREELIEKVWSVEFGADESLSRAVSVLRKGFRRVAGDVGFIETIPRRGYRITVPVTAVEDVHPNHSATRLSLKPPPNRQDYAFSGRQREERDRRKFISTPWPIVAIGFLAVVAMIATFIRSPTETIEVSLQRIAYADSIAVLPFEPFSDDPVDLRFSDGITEDLVNALSKIGSLAVAARPSTSQYVGTSIEPRAVAEALGVNNLVFGTVRRNPETVRVTTQLVRGADGIVIWSDTLETPVAETFILQDQIVEQIRQSLELRLGVGAGRGTIPAAEVDPRAVEFYFQGLEHFANRFRTNGAVQSARESLLAAVEIEPDFAKAWRALARVGVAWSGGPLARDKERYMAELKRDIERALELNENDPALHATLVSWHTTITLDLEAAAFHLEKAQALAPGSVDTLVAASAYYWMVGRPDEAQEMLSKVRRLDPLNDVVKLEIARQQAMLGEIEEAFEFFDECRRASCLQEGFIPYGAMAAILSSDPDRMASWSVAYDEFEAFATTLPASLLPRVVEVQGALFSTKFNQADLQQEQTRVQELLAHETITDHIGMWGPVFATFLPEDMFFDLLEAAYERRGLFSTPYGFSPLYYGNEYPTWVLEHTRYHALWEREGLKALAQARRANGMQNGLPK